MKKLFALASMMVVISVSAQQPKIDKQEGKRIEIQQQKERKEIKDKQAKKEVDKRDEFYNKDKKTKDKRHLKKEQDKITFQEKQRHHKKDFPRGQKEIAYQPFKMR